MSVFGQGGGCEQPIPSYTGAALPCSFKARFLYAGKKVCRRHASMLLRRAAGTHSARSVADKRYVKLAPRLATWLKKRGQPTDVRLALALDEWYAAQQMVDLRRSAREVADLPRVS